MPGRSLRIGGGANYLGWQIIRAGSEAAAAGSEAAAETAGALKGEAFLSFEHLKKEEAEAPGSETIA